MDDTSSASNTPAAGGEPNAPSSAPSAETSSENVGEVGISNAHTAVPSEGPPNKLDNASTTVEQQFETAAEGQDASQETSSAEDWQAREAHLETQRAKNNKELHLRPGGKLQTTVDQQVDATNESEIKKCGFSEAARFNEKTHGTRSN